MNDTSKLNKRASINRVLINGGNDNIKYYQYFFLALIVLLILVDILFQNGVQNVLISRAWGINNFAYFPVWIQVLVFSILLAFAIPSINNYCREYLQNFTERFAGKKIGRAEKFIWFFSISSFITLLFYLFKVKYDLLGDTDLRVSQSVNGKYINDEYFTMYLLHYINILFHKHFLIPHQTFVLHSLFAGFCYCFLSLLIANLLFDDIRSFIVFFLFCISIGTILVFCGYVEIYAIPAASVALYIYAALLYLKNKVSILFPLFCLILAVVFHLEQMSLIPSFVYLAVRKIKFFSFLNGKIILLLSIVAVPLIYILNAFLGLTSLTPLTKIVAHPGAYTLLSTTHFWEFFNAEYLSSGVYLFIAVIIIINILRGKIKEDACSLFFLTASLFAMVIVFTTNKERGSGDWDICSFPAIPLTMFIAYIGLTQWKTTYATKKLFYILSVPLILNTFNCWAWVGINSSQKSLAKIQDMLLTDPGYYYQTRLPAEIELSILLEKAGAIDKAMKYYEASYEKYGNTMPVATVNYIGILMSRKDTNKVIPVLESNITAHPYFFDSYNLLFTIYEKRKQQGLLYSRLKDLLTLYFKNPDAVTRDPKGKELIMHCAVYMYKVSIANKDDATTEAARKAMQQLKINVK